MVTTTTAWVRELRQIRVYETGPSYETVGRLTLFPTAFRAVNEEPQLEHVLASVFELRSARGPRRDWHRAGWVWVCGAEVYGARETHVPLALLERDWLVRPVASRS